MNILEIENRLREIFEDNYNFLKLEGGHAITDFAKEEAFKQVLCYYRKNIELIKKITEAEVKLTLPEQKTPNEGIRYTIEGIIDIIREGDVTWMYDIKSHDKQQVENNRDQYRNQLSVYAYIWKSLRGNDLDNTAIIATALPKDLKRDLLSDDLQIRSKAFNSWDPIVPLGYSEEEVDEMINDFGLVVEKIEGKQFTPPPVERLTARDEGERNIYAVNVCRNCDARFSCESFRSYVRTKDKGKNPLKRYLDDYGTEIDSDEFLEANLNQTKLDDITTTLQEGL